MHSAGVRMELPVKPVLRGTPVGVLQDLQVSQKHTLFFDTFIYNKDSNYNVIYLRDKISKN